MRPRKPGAHASRLRRRQSEAKGDQGGSDGCAVSGERGGSGEGMLATDAAQLMERMRRRSEERRKAEVRVGEREGWIKSRYADTAAGARFDKDDVLAGLIADTKSSFLKLDQELSEDHSIATQRLHAAVFAHTSDFLQLFRDVNRASTLVESLKGRVQGTKAAISAISKFSAYFAGADDGDSRAGSETFGVSLLCGGGEVGGGGSSSNSIVKARARPSLISVRLTRGDTAVAKAYAINVRGGSSFSDASTTHFNHDGDGSGGVGVAAEGGGAAGSDDARQVVTTRSLNTPSVRLWRDATLAAGGASASMQRHRHQRLDLDRNRGMPSSQDIALFADVLRDEVVQLLAGRRYLEAAELLRGVEAAAVAKGCLPLILRLDEMLVGVIRTQLLRVPMPLMYSESLHIPLVQLLLRLGRVHRGTRLFFQLHAAWVDAEMDKLQLRMDPMYGALIASDFLVGAMQEVLLRQQNLWNAAGLKHEGTPHGADKDEWGRKKAEKALHGVGAGNINNSSNSNSNSGDGVVHRTTDGGKGGPGGASKVAAQPGVFTMPPNSAAVLWVRERVDKLARELLGTRALSYGIGAEGGDPSRFRRAVMMAADAIRTMRRMDDSGYAGCDTHLLRLLTPSLVYLQADFSVCMDVRLESTGMAMVEHLVRDARLMYETREAAYNPKACEEAARRNNLGCRELQQRLRQLPRTSYALLLELLLAPASSSLFKQQGCGGEALPPPPPPQQQQQQQLKQLLSPEKYTFLRYANGCTHSHGLLLSSLIRFVAAMTGQESLPLERMEQQLTQEPTEELQENKLECVSFLLSNALVLESLDITIQRLLLSFLRTTLRQRQALVSFLRSAPFINMHRQLFGVAWKSAAAPPSAFTARWLLDAMQLLLADVLSASVWVAFLSRGGALSYMLCDSALTFRSQYLEELRRVLPRLVQGWMAAVLSLAHNLDAADNLLIGDAAALLPPSAAAAASAASAGEKDEEVAVAGLRRDRATSTVTAVAASYVKGGNGAYDAAAQLLQAAAVDEARLTPFLLSLVHDQFLACAAGEVEAAWSKTPPQPSPAPLLPPLRSLREVLGSYPQFPTGGDFDHNDELFLFHWCAQISLNTIAFFQEHLVLPSHVVNEQWAAQPHGSAATGASKPGSPAGARYPLRGCVSPQEESVLGALAAGGGSYVSGAALLQFIFFRLLRDVLCRVETWNTLYGLPPEQWRQSESVLRQQIFFFALLARIWSPLFVGAAGPAAEGGAVTTNRNGNIDGAPALVILQWLTCAAQPRESQTGPPSPSPSPSPCGFDVEGLAFSSTVVGAAAASPASRGPGAWRSQRKSGNRGEGEEETVGRDGTATPLPGKSQAAAAPSPAGGSASTSGDATRLSLLLLDVIASFFDALQEPRAMPAINSEVTRTRVEKVVASVNLADFAWKAGLSGSDDEEEDEYEDEEEEDDDDSIGSSGSGAGSRTTGSSALSPSPQTAAAAEESSRPRVTLLHVHDLLVYYFAPLL
ncbi:uncharacterized protein Tco025E_02265 [Trypanosoma conorhini]|uniref:Uncharacterized protein n=1 Tax=Trypanosoma conorhini TaxID=83891 RepID=A0A422Q5Y0_9TRYP|nr:uncharacterized protein Tco025E_02265 [Trypanosoma conorhini]RNF25361.1 hypothetical protein Tco025E_02265 [Trypanosoma conorhini]